MTSDREQIIPVFTLCVASVFNKQRRNRRWVGGWVGGGGLVSMNDWVIPPLRSAAVVSRVSVQTHMLVLILVWLLAGVSSPWLPSLGGDLT